MARPRPPLGPLLELKPPSVRVQQLDVLASKLTRAKLPNTVLSEDVQVDAHGTVTRMMALCQHCTGDCCGSLNIPITRRDAKRLAKALGHASTRSLPLLPLDGDEDPDLDYAGYLSRGDSPCPYFDKGCSVHEHRPDVCRSFGLLACASTQSFRARDSRS
ncbi:YkgJ family cysteine cluster protein [Nannocystaceae bacterium ST9]